MKKLKIAAVFCALAACLCACGTLPENDAASEPESQIVSEAVSSETVSEEDSEEPVVSETEEESSVPEVKHSKLYIEGYTQDQIVEYFNEVVLATEYATGSGDASLVQKWEQPIRYRTYGQPTGQDLQKLEALLDQLNAVEGFPGIYSVNDGGEENLSICFYGNDDFYAEFGEFLNYEPSDGAVQYWYFDDDNKIYEARIGYRSDIDQATRMTVIPEEIVNGLGISDTIHREDSITYQYANNTEDLSEIDWLLIKLLYHPDIRAGMDQAQCEQVIRSLYY